MKLVYEDGREVKLGDTVNLNGEDHIVTFIVYPVKPSSVGRVEVMSEIRQRKAYFPDFIGAKWIEREDQHA